MLLWCQNECERPYRNKTATSLAYNVGKQWTTFATEESTHIQTDAFVYLSIHCCGGLGFFNHFSIHFAIDFFSETIYFRLNEGSINWNNNNNNTFVYNFLLSAHFTSSSIAGSFGAFWATLERIFNRYIKVIYIHKFIQCTHMLELMSLWNGTPKK